MSHTISFHPQGTGASSRSNQGLSARTTESVIPSAQWQSAHTLRTDLFHHFELFNLDSSIRTMKQATTWKPKGLFHASHSRLLLKASMDLRASHRARTLLIGGEDRDNITANLLQEFADLFSDLNPDDARQKADGIVAAASARVAPLLKDRSP